MLNTINLSGINTEYNNIYYISTNGNDDIGNGTKEQPFATYDKVFSLVTDGDLIYFIKGNYNISNLSNIGNANFGGGFIYDKGIQLIIYAEPLTHIIINNPTNIYRDSHAISTTNTNTKIIGFIIDWNVTNKGSDSAPASRSIIGHGDYLYGKIYNCHFIIRSATSFSYANISNTIQCVNCQFDIQTTLDKGYSGKTKFINCTMNLSSWSDAWGIATDSDILTNILYDSKYHIIPTNDIYGVYNKDYKWGSFKYLIKQNDNYYGIKPEFYDEERDQYSPILLQNPTVDDFNNYGVLDLGTIKFNA